MSIFSLLHRNKQKSDRELIIDYKSHDNFSALDELFQRYIHLVFFVCEKYLKNLEDSKDAVMEIFEKSVEQLKKYEVTDFKKWIYATAKNHCAYKLKRKAALPVIEKNVEKFENFFMENQDFSHLLSEREAQFQKLEWALNHLEEVQKTCIDLFYFQRKSYQQIAEMTGYSIKQVKSSIQNGKRKLKILINKEKNNA